MEVCSFNWELASKFVPLVTPVVSIFLAIFVYRVWHTQKGKEVIANQAKESIIQLTKLDNLHKEIFNGIRKEELDPKKIQEFNALHKEFSDSSTFLLSALRSDKKLSKLLNAVLNQSVSFSQNVKTWWDTSELDNAKVIKASDVLILTQELLRYSLYKKSV